MRGLVERDRASIALRDLAAQAGLRGGVSTQEAATRAHAFVAERVAYQAERREVLHRATDTLARAVGDCDEMALLTATLLEAAGYPTRFRAILQSLPSPLWRRGERQQHVYAQVWDPVIGWIDVDPTLGPGERLAPPLRTLDYP